MLYNGRRSGIKDGIGFQQGSQSNTKLSAPRTNYITLLRVRLPWLKIHARKTHTVSHHAYMYRNEASSSNRSTHIKMPKKKIANASNEHSISFKTFDASFLLTRTLNALKQWRNLRDAMTTA
jgi:hypothetical protein